MSISQFDSRIFINTAKSNPHEQVKMAFCQCYTITKSSTLFDSTTLMINRLCMHFHQILNSLYMNRDKKYTIHNINNIFIPTEFFNETALFSEYE